MTRMSTWEVQTENCIEQLRAACNNLSSVADRKFALNKATILYGKVSQAPMTVPADVWSSMSTSITEILKALPRGSGAAADGQNLEEKLRDIQELMGFQRMPSASAIFPPSHTGNSLSVNEPSEDPKTPTVGQTSGGISF